MRTEPSDAEIVQAVLAGDRERFGVLVDRHGRALFGFAIRRTAGRDEAREVFQETLVRAFERLASLRDAHQVRGWLFGIASRVLLQRRRLGRAPERDASVHELAAPQRSDALERSETSARIARAVGELPERQREVFELRALHELSHAQIAELLGISEESSRASFYQAVKKLRERLGGDL
jgi:RNA polymerase sigma-70 factor (ECF subfamily)